MYETYIFDLYGTLIDIVTDEESHEVWERLAVHFRYSGMTIEAASLQETVAGAIESQLQEVKQKSGAEHPEFEYEQVFASVAASLGGTVSEAWLHETVRWFRILSIRHLKLYDYAKELLGSLAAQGKKIYLLSNGQRTFIEAELAILGIRDLFDGLAISSEAGVSKPDPRFYHYLEERFGADLSSAMLWSATIRVQMLKGRDGSGLTLAISIRNPPRRGLSSTARCGSRTAICARCRAAACWQKDKAARERAWRHWRGVSVRAMEYVDEERRALPSC